MVKYNTKFAINHDLNIFYWLCYYSCPIFFSPLSPSILQRPLTTIPSPLSSCPCVMHIKFIGFLISYTFLNTPLFCTYQLCFLIPVPFPPFSSFPLPTDNPLNDLHIYNSQPVLAVCLVCFCFLDSVVDSWEFVVILLFIILIFFFLNKSL